MRQTRCVDCNEMGRRTSRAATNPGPRCREHWLIRKRAVSKSAHGKRLEKDFQIGSDTYDLLLESQGGVCFGCGRAKGISRRLCVDHDHNCDAGHPPEMGCPKCIRALLCAYCNEVIGRLDAQALARLIIVLTDPPARKVLRAMMLIEDEGNFTP
jgi:hypothetical protein